MGYIAAALKKLRKPLIALAIVATLLALAAYVTRPREPVYEGKRLSEWLGDIHSNEWKWKHSTRAVRTIGTNGIPFLIDALRTKDKGSQLGKAVRNLLRRQNFVPVNHTSAELIRLQARTALLQLEPLDADSKAAILRGINDMIQDEELALDGLRCLRDLNYGTEALPLLTRVMAAANRKAHPLAAQGIAMMCLKNKSEFPLVADFIADDASYTFVTATAARGIEAAPVLLMALESRNADARGLASRFLSGLHHENADLLQELARWDADSLQFLTNAAESADADLRLSATPVLEEVQSLVDRVKVILAGTGGENVLIRYQAAIGLANIGEQPAIWLPAVIDLSRHTNALYRFVAARSLEKRGSKSPEAIQRLEAMSKDSDELVRKEAERLLKLLR